jgi:hypothetical protein
MAQIIWCTEPITRNGSRLIICNNSATPINANINFPIQHPNDKSVQTRDIFEKLAMGFLLAPLLINRSQTALDPFDIYPL